MSEQLSRVDWLTRQLAIEKAARRTAERRAQAFAQHAQKLRAELAALSRRQPESGPAAAAPP
jgi:hypothetical protein